MKHFLHTIAAAALALASLHAAAQASVLERYALASGGTLGGDAGNISAFIQDDRFGGGDAKASVYLDTVENGMLLNLRVWRHVPAGRISFALLVFAIDVRGLGADGTELYTRELADFSFGDSATGNWTTRLKLPSGVSRVEVRFIGNYE